jgi:SAM-dependent methyltransferase
MFASRATVRAEASCLSAEFNLFIIELRRGPQGFSRRYPMTRRRKPAGQAAPVPVHYYERIQGWFNFRRVYEEMVARATPAAVFVEVGCWKGRSAAFLGVEILRSGKPIALHCVDHFKGSEEAAHRADPQVSGLRAIFDANMAPCVAAGLELTVHRASSDKAAATFADASVDFVWLDAGHDHASVTADIAAWLPKVKPGGVLGGDDWPMDGVARAVREALGAGVILRGENGWTTWMKEIGR